MWGPHLQAWGQPVKGPRLLWVVCQAPPRGLQCTFPRRQHTDARLRAVHCNVPWPVAVRAEGGLVAVPQDVPFLAAVLADAAPRALTREVARLAAVVAPRGGTTWWGWTGPHAWPIWLTHHHCPNHDATWPTLRPTWPTKGPTKGSIWPTWPIIWSTWPTHRPTACAWRGGWAVNRPVSLVATPLTYDFGAVPLQVTRLAASVTQRGQRHCTRGEYR
jgi:hypothetical protein